LGGGANVCEKNLLLFAKRGLHNGLTIGEVRGFDLRRGGAPACPLPDSEA